MADTLNRRPMLAKLVIERKRIQFVFAAKTTVTARSLGGPYAAHKANIRRAAMYLIY